MYQDVSGPEMARLLTEMSASPDFALNFLISQTAVVGDEIGMFPIWDLLALGLCYPIFFKLFSQRPSEES